MSRQTKLTDTKYEIKIYDFKNTSNKKTYIVTTDDLTHAKKLAFKKFKDEFEGSSPQISKHKKLKENKMNKKLKEIYNKVMKENISKNEIEQVFKKYTKDPGYDEYVDVSIQGNKYVVGTNWVDSSKIRSKQAHKNAIDELKRKYKITNYKIDLDPNASVTSYFQLN